MRSEMKRFVEATTREPALAGGFLRVLKGRRLQDAVDDVVAFAVDNGYRLTASDFLDARQSVDRG